MTFFYLFTTILALNLMIISRLNFYFLTYNILLLTNILSVIKDKKTKTLLIWICIIVALLQFSITASNGSAIGIENYKFFWEGV